MDEQRFRLIHRDVTRKLLLYFNLFGVISLNKHVIPREDELEHLAEIRGKSTNQTERALAETNESPRHRYPEWLANLCLAIYLYVSVKLLATIGVQYKHDFDMIRLRRIHEMLSSTPHNATSMFVAGVGFNPSLLNDQDRARLAALEVELVASAAHWYDLLKRLGAPHVNCTIIVECAQILLILITHSVYLYGKYLDVKIPIDMHICSCIMNWPLEFLRCRRMVEEEVLAILNSSSNSARVMIQRVKQCEGRLRQIAEQENRSLTISYKPDATANKRQSPTSNSTDESICDLSCSLEEHESLKKILRTLSRDDRLVPVNRLDDWINSMSLQFSVYTVVNLIYTSILDVSIVVLLPIRANLRLELANLMDKLALGELFFFVFIAMNSTVFYLAILSTNATDQARYIKHIQAIFLDCSKQNLASMQQLVLEDCQGRVLVAARDSSQPKAQLNSSALERKQSKLQLEQVNTNLAKSILEYKIFAKQFKLIQRSFSYVTLALYLILFMVPLLIRLHIPYLDIDSSWFGVSFSISMLMLTNSISIPICIIHYQGMRLYRIMSSVLAQAIELNEQNPESTDNRDGSTTRVYNAHLVWQLRHILADPQHFTDQFASQAFPGVLLTFGSLTRIHYLYSLINISAFVQLESWQKLFGSRLNDPFGIFNNLISASFADNLVQ